MAAIISKSVITVTTANNSLDDFYRILRQSPEWGLFSKEELIKHYHNGKAQGAVVIKINDNVVFCVWLHTTRIGNDSYICFAKDKTCKIPTLKLKDISLKILEYYFKTYDLKRLKAEIRKDNRPSRIIAIGLGFKKKTENQTYIYYEKER